MRTSREEVAPARGEYRVGLLWSVTSKAGCRQKAKGRCMVVSAFVVCHGRICHTSAAALSTLDILNKTSRPSRLLCAVIRRAENFPLHLFCPISNFSAAAAAVSVGGAFPRAATLLSRQPPPPPALFSAPCISRPPGSYFPTGFRGFNVLRRRRSRRQRRLDFRRRRSLRCN
jgi:hypothetical protein